MEITDEMRETVPEALYGCAKQSCAEEKSVRSSKLWWYRDGFYCDLCIDWMKYTARNDSVQHQFGARLPQVLHNREEAAPELVAAIPEPVYPCTTHECAIEVSYPANMLGWFDDGFYCEECIEGDAPALDDTQESEDAYDARHNGPSLAEVLKTPGVVE